MVILPCLKPLQFPNFKRVLHITPFEYRSFTRRVMPCKIFKEIPYTPCEHRRYIIEFSEILSCTKKKDFSYKDIEINKIRNPCEKTFSSNSILHCSLVMFNEVQ